MAGFHLENFIRGGSAVIIMKGEHDQMKSRHGFYSKLGYCEGVVEEFWGEVGEIPPSRGNSGWYVCMVWLYILL